MKRLDLYFLSIFVPAMLVCAAFFIGLAVLVDAILRVQELVSIGSVKFLIQFYGMRLPLFARTVLPLVPLFAAAFTVVRLSKAREIVPMIAAGANLRRLFAPFVLFGLGAAGLIAAIEEWALPPIADDLAVMEATLRGGTRKRTASVIDSDASGNYLFASVYDPARRRLQGSVLLLQIPPGGTLERRITCGAAEWSDVVGGWVFFDGEIWEYESGKRLIRPSDGAARPASEPVPIPREGVHVKIDLRPERVKRGADSGDRFASFADARAAAQEYPDVPFFFARLLDRLTYPLTPLLLLLIGLPFVTGLDEKTHVKGLFLCFVIAVAYFGAYLVGQDFAVQGLIPPLVGCWGPPVLFGCAGGILYGTIRT